MKRNKDQFKKNISEKEILIKLFRYCAYQERSVRDVKKQLDQYPIDQELKNRFIIKLKAEGFLNEERFARTYMLGKLRNNQWGKLKIVHGLKEKSIDHEIIQTVMDTLDEGEYIQIIDDLIQKKKAQLLTEKDPYILKNKIARYIIYKGFESVLVWNRIKKRFE
jgi:regulatory protein